MLNLKCKCCGQPLCVKAGEYSDWHKKTGRPPRYYVDCRNEACAMHMQTFYVANQAEYDDHDFEKYVCEKAG